MRTLYSHDYRTAGLGTLMRQLILGGIERMPYLRVSPLTIAAQFVVKSVAHRANMAIKMLENVAAMSTILVEQAAYPLLLQTSHEIDKLMATQIPLEQKQVNVFKIIHPFFLITSPLAYLSIGNYIDSFESQIGAHQTVLDRFNEMWTWVEKTKVTYVEDGDTIYVAEYPTIPIRIEGIDCPETFHAGFTGGDPNDPKWDAGNEAKAFTESKLLGKEVKLRARTERDIYDRIIAKVYFPGDNDFAWTLLGAGHGEMMFSTWFT